MTPDVNGRIREVLRAAGDRESGDVLFAEHVAPGRFRVIGMSLDAAGRAPSRLFAQPGNASAYRTGFPTCRREDQRFNYLSEWHSFFVSARPAPPTWPPPQPSVSHSNSQAQHRYRMIHANRVDNAGYRSPVTPVRSTTAAAFRAGGPQQQQPMVRPANTSAAAVATNADAERPVKKVLNDAST